MLLKHAHRWASRWGRENLMAPSIPASLLRSLQVNLVASWPISTTSEQEADGRGAAADDQEGNPDGKQKKGKYEIITDAEVEQTPMIYNFAGVEPDQKASRLSEETKERIWRAYTDNPEPVTVERLAKEFRIRKQRVHAIVWLKDIEKKEEEVLGRPLEDDIEQAFANIHGTYEAADNERHVTMPRTGPGVKGAIEDGEDGEGPDTEDLSAKEELMLVEEFERRMSFNKKQIAGLILTDVRSRRRPPGGWRYLIEELGEEGKRGKRGGRRFVAEPDGTHRGLNELEKEFLKRETLRPRRRLTPR